MKRSFILLWTATFLFMAHSSLAQCPSNSNRNVILTEGMAEVTGQNDSAKISLAVVTEGRNLDQASAENAGKIDAVLKGIKDLRIENLKLKTANYRVTPQKDYKTRPPKIVGYEVSNAVEVTLEGFDPEPLSGNVSKIIEKALEGGSNNINYIQFYIKNSRSLEKEALKQATREAMDRARILAEAAGVKLKRVVSLSTQPSHLPPRPQMLRTAEMNADAAAPPMEIGESQIRVSVNIAYEIEP